jgi:hypothetical protein
MGWRRADIGSAVLLGTLFTVASVLLSSVGSLTASRNRSRGLPMWPALGWGMFCGAIASVVVLLVSASASGRAAAPPSPLADPHDVDRIRELPAWLGNVCRRGAGGAGQRLDAPAGARNARRGNSRNVNCTGSVEDRGQQTYSAISRLAF